MKDSERLARIDQKLTDFMLLYQEHRKADQAHFDTLGKLKIKMDRIERPLKWAGGVFTVSAVGFLTVVGERLGRWILHRP